MTFLSTLRTWWRKHQEETTSSIDKIVNLICEDIESNPHLWVSDKYYLKRVTGESIWIANEAYALEIKAPFLVTKSMLGSANREKIYEFYENYIRWRCGRVDEEHKINKALLHFVITQKEQEYIRNANPL